MENKNGLRVLIVGGAGACKTTMALKLQELLIQAGASVVTVEDEDVRLGTSYENLQPKRWDAIKGRSISIVTNQSSQSRPPELSFHDKNVAKYVLQSPITENACHMISWPGADGYCWVNDLDAGEIMRVEFTALKNQPMIRNVASSDFGFSWCAESEHLSNNLYNWVMEQIDD